jgi:hypothetical protein
MEIFVNIVPTALVDELPEMATVLVNEAVPTALVAWLPLMTTLPMP